MASEVGSATANGVHHASNGTSSHASSTTDEIPKDEVAWYFVEQYYTTLSRSPDKLYLFFNKRSQYVSGVEDEKVSVRIGQKAINERIKELDFSETKVRVTNVDSQASDNNIVIQAIGELSNKSQTHRKFVQTFVLAGQTNGYFVLNDIFRYIKEDDEEEELPEAAQPTETSTAGSLEPTHTVKEEAAPSAPDSAKANVANDEAVIEVDNKLEDVIKQDTEGTKETASATTNGTPAEEEAVEADTVPAAAISSTEATEEETTEASVSETVLEPEKPKDPAPSPTPAAAAKPKAAPAPSGPPKPIVPKSWAQLAAGNRAAAAAAAVPAAPSASATSATTAASQQKTPPSASSQSHSSAAPTPAAAAAPPVREPSPDSQKSGSQGGWQTAGADHTRKASRAQVPPVASDNGRVRAYVKNVVPSITNEELKAHLEKFGELVYFDVNRPKNAAFAEFGTKAAFDAAVKANPHKIRDETIFVEERRMQPGQFGRGGGSLRGRGGFEGRGGGAPGSGGRGGFKQDGQGGGAPGGRGGYGGPRGGRGGSGARGRGGPPQAA